MTYLQLLDKLQELQSEGIDLDNYDVMIGFDDEYFAIFGGSS